MTTYTVYFRSDLQSGMREIIAQTPEQALDLARQLASENPDNMVLDYFFEACDCPINEIEICDDHGNSLVTWFDDDMRLRLAATDLLEAAHLCEMALCDLETSRRKGYLTIALAKTRAAIAKAKRGAP